MTPDPRALLPLAQVYLARQPWFLEANGGVAETVELVAHELLRSEAPGLDRLVLASGDRRFQLLVGWRRPADAASALRGREGALLGPVTVGRDHLLCFDALEDDELALALLGYATGGTEEARRVRRLSSLTSHASLVFDERFFMKCYRVLEHGIRPEVEAVLRLDAAGFNAMVPPVAHWRAHDHDLALVREFLPSALEGRLLALTSLRDLLARTDEILNASPGETAAAAGGDLASEMYRLGVMTAGLHIALAGAFGIYPVDAEALDALLAGDDARGSPPGAMQGAVGSLGQAIRLHGDYHLRRVMRTEMGWVVAGFSDDPILSERAIPSLPPRTGSPLEDIADMCWSLSLVAHEALAHRRGGVDPEISIELVAAWERRNRVAFVSGYTGVPAAAALLPDDPALVEELLAAFELARERRYEATPSAV